MKDKKVLITGGLGFIGSNLARRLAGRPKIPDIIGNNVKTEDKGTRNKKVIDLIYNWGYSQKEVADNLNLHYSSISKILRRGKEQAKTGGGK